MHTLNPRIDNWHGQRVWLIGASNGIGEALAGQLQAHGARLALSARTVDKLNMVANSNDLVLQLDVQDADAVAEAHRQLLECWGGIDLLIYCAGVYTPMRSDALQLEQIRQAVSINLMGAYQAIETVLPPMLARSSGAVCLVASIAGFTGLPQAIAYGPTKAAMINLAQILYTELSARGIGIYLVNPGFVDTRLTRQNDFQMPALINVQQAATHILRGFARGQFEIHFPKRFSLVLKFVSILPYRLRFSLLKRLNK